MGVTQEGMEVQEEAAIKQKTHGAFTGPVRLKRCRTGKTGYSSLF